MNQFLLIEESLEADISWSRHQAVVEFDIPFQSMNCRITLDKMLPRIAILAESAPDRKTKIAACELLHAIFLLILGQHSFTKSATAGESKFLPIWKKLFPVIMRLGVDMDKITRDLFRSLTLQTIRWLTQNATSKTLGESAVVLQTCVDSCTSLQPSLRDFGSESIAELLKYSIKHSVTDLKAVHSSAFSILQRIFYLCQHSNGNFRLGGLIMWNKIYKIFREQEELVGEFSLEILYYLLYAVKMSSKDDYDSELTALSKKSIGHIIKIIKHEYHLFQTPNRDRHFPGLSEKEPVIDHIFEWLFLQFSEPHVLYVRTCMLTFMEVKEPSEIQTWVNEYLHAKPWYLNTYWKSMLIFDPRIVDILLIPSVWIQKLETTLQAYNFFLDSCIVEYKDILEIDRTFWLHILNLFKLTIRLDYSKSLKLVEKNCRLASAISQALILINIMLKNVPGSERPSTFTGILQTDLCKMVAKIVSNPGSLGFPNDLETKKNIESLICSFVAYIKPEQDIYTILIDELFAVVHIQAITECDENENEAFVALEAQMKLLEIFGKVGVFADMESRFDVQGLSFWVLECLKNERMQANSNIYSVLQNLLTICIENSSDSKIGIWRLVFEKLPLKYISESLLDTLPKNLDYIMANYKSSSDLVNSMIESFLLKQLSRNQSAHKTELALFSKQIAKNEYIFLLCDTHLINLTLFHFNVERLQHDSFLYLCNAYLIRLKRCNTLNDPLLPLLHVFLMELCADKQKLLILSALRRIVKDLFPSVPCKTNLLDDGDSFGFYKLLVTSLLESLRISRNNGLLEILVGHICRENSSFAEALSVSMRSIGQDSTPQKFLSIANEIFGVFYDSSGDIELRYNIVQQALIPLLESASNENIALFFQTKIGLIFESIAGKVTLSTSQEKKLVISATFDLLRVMYKLPKVYVHSALSPIVISFSAFLNEPLSQPHIGKEISNTEASDKLVTGATILKARAIRFGHFSKTGSVGYHIDLKLHQAAFKAIAAALYCTQKEPAIFQFLFKDNYLKGEIIWDRIIDLNRPNREFTYILPLGQRNRKPDVSYLSTMYLDGSSLTQRPSLNYNQAIKAPSGENEVSTTVVKVTSDILSVFVAIFNADWPSDHLKQWLEFLLLKMRPDVPWKVRCFVLNIIIEVKNKIRIEEDNVCDWWNSVVDLLTVNQLYENHEEGTDGSHSLKTGKFNGFIYHGCALLCEWSTVRDSQYSANETLKLSRLMVPIN